MHKTNNGKTTIVSQRAKDLEVIYEDVTLNSTDKPKTFSVPYFHHPTNSLSAVMRYKLETVSTEVTVKKT